MPPIRHIVYECLPGAYAGGVQKMVFELASAQRRLGADVEIWTVDAARAGKTEVHGVLPVRYFSPDYAMGYVRSLELNSALSLFQNIGTGNFTNTSLAARVDFPTGWNAWGVAVGDFNGDGKPDLAVANSGSDSVSILLGTGTGTFSAKTDYPTGIGMRGRWVALFARLRDGGMAEGASLFRPTS